MKKTDAQNQLMSISKRITDLIFIFMLHTSAYENEIKENVKRRQYKFICMALFTLILTIES